jgi:hypothetical protein
MSLEVNSYFTTVMACTRANILSSSTSSIWPDPMHPGGFQNSIEIKTVFNSIKIKAAYQKHHKICNLIKHVKL